MAIDRYKKMVVIPIALIGVTLILLMVIQRFSSLSIWDDAYIFWRYANNFVETGILSWNPSGAPTYGLTSLAYLIFVIPFRSLFPSMPALVMILSSLTSGIFALVALIFIARKLVKASIDRLIFVVVFALSFMVASEDIATHLTSGMDTTFSVFAIILWIGTLYLSDKWVIWAIGGALIYTVRPDAMIFVAAVLLAFGTSRLSHSQSIRLIIVVCLSLTVLLGTATLYFGTPLPLPFFAKSTPIYGTEFYGYYINTAPGYFFNFVLSYPYLFLIIFLSLLRNFRVWSWQDRGLLLGLILFCGYHIQFVVPIMGFYERFFYPCLPILLILTIRWLPALRDQIPISLWENIKSYRSPVLWVPLLLVFGLINPLAIIITLVQYSTPQYSPTRHIGQFDLTVAYHELYDDNWFRLDNLSALPDTITIATTEIGLPGAMNPHKQIIDLAGLNEPDFALNGFSADQLFADGNRPDWIYMPFPHYEDMWYDIYEHPVFMEEYIRYPAQSIRTSMDVAIYRGSPNYTEILKVLTQP